MPARIIFRGLTAFIWEGKSSTHYPTGRMAAVLIDGQPLVRRVVQRVPQVSQEIVVVVADQARGEALPLDS